MGFDLKLFTRSFSAHHHALEEALRSLEVVLMDFYDNGIAKSLDAYILPVDFHNSLRGYFHINQEDAEAKIGFEHRPSIFVANYYHMSASGELLLKDRSTDVLYIPLQITGNKVDITTSHKMKLTECSRHDLLGVRDISGRVLPLLLATETEKGIEFQGFYKDMNAPKAYMKNATTVQHDIARTIIRPAKPPAMHASANEQIMQSIKHQIITSSSFDWREPKSIVKFLDRYIIGQERAKKSAAVAFSNYMALKEVPDPAIRKDNLLLIGGSGTGKTRILTLLADHAGLPLAKTKATGKSSEGYRGQNLSSIFSQIISKTKDPAPYGIVFIDEIDKLTGAENYFGPKLQEEIIGWENATVDIDGDVFLTNNLLIVAAGAFNGNAHHPSLAKIIGERSGMHNATQDMLQQVRPEDLIEYGLITELVGRFPVIGVLHPLSIEDKVQILTTAKDSVLQGYMRLLEIKGYNPQLEEGFAQFIAEQAPQDTGARALHSVCNEVFTDLLYDPAAYAKNNKIILDTTIAKKLIVLYQEKEKKRKTIGFL
jgi:ATP-dependent Clp protease ATP-binding subunit ClpX